MTVANEMNPDQEEDEGKSMDSEKQEKVRVKFQSQLLMSDVPYVSQASDR